MKDQLPIYIENDKTKDGQSQITRMQKRGIVFSKAEIADAKEFLKVNSYYRFSGYTYVYEEYNRNNKARTHKYPQGLTFSEIKTAYLFDKKLRSLIMEALEEVEISFKVMLCNSLCATEADSNWLHNEYLFFDKDSFNSVVATCTRSVEQNTHFSYLVSKNYSYLESWKIMEIMTFGDVLKVYNKLRLKYRPYKEVNQHFGLFNADTSNMGREQRYKMNTKQMEQLTSVMVSLKNLRNHCAHHHRLVGFNFKSKPPVLNKDSYMHSPEHVSVFIHTLRQMLNSTRTNNTWFTRVKELVVHYGNEMTYYDKVPTENGYYYENNNSDKSGTEFLSYLIGFNFDITKY